MPESIGTVKVQTLVEPAVPVGLATKTGLAAAVGQFAAAGAAAATDHTPEAVGAFVGATLTLLTVLGGRYAQAAASIKTQVHPVIESVGSYLDEIADELDDPDEAFSEVPVPVLEQAPTPSVAAHTGLGDRQ